MNWNKFRIGLSLFGIFLVFFSKISYPFALEYGGIGGRPANPQADNPRTESIFIYSLSPSEGINDGVQIINNTESEKTLLVYAVDSLVSSDGAFGCKQFREEKTGVGNWIVLSKSQVTLASKTHEVVPFILSLPENVSVGEHNGCIVIQELKALDETEKSGVSLSFRAAIRVAVTVPGDIVKKVKITDFSVTKKEDGSILLRPEVENEGNVSVDANVNVYTKYLFGLAYSKLGGRYPLLRGEKASWNFELNKPFWGGWYRSYVVMEYDASTLRELGKDSLEEISTLEFPPIFFFSSPKPTAIVIELFLLLGMVVISYQIYRKYKQRKWIANTWIEYRCETGDDINMLAQKYGVSWKLLTKVNKLYAPFSLSEGMLLRVPKIESKKA